MKDDNLKTRLKPYIGQKENHPTDAIDSQTDRHYKPPELPAKDPIVSTA